jgi:hypothetical protein
MNVIRLSGLKAAALAFALAFSPAQSEAATFEVVNDNLFITVGTVTGDMHLGSVNLAEYNQVVLDWRAFVTGSLTLTTYVDPLLPAGVGNTTVRLLEGFQGPGNLFTSQTVQWGDDGPVLNIPMNGPAVAISTTFTDSGLPGQDLVFRWTTQEDQVSDPASFTAAVSAIPLPAGGWLLLTAFGSLIVAKRRRKEAAA